MKGSGSERFCRIGKPPGHGVNKMNKYDILNEKMRLQYEASPTEDNFKLYVMSELLPMIENYIRVQELIYEKIETVTDKKLLIIAAFLNIYWPADMENVFLEKLNQSLESAEDSEKAIIYYLNAYKMETDNLTCKNLDLQRYIDFLEKSVDCSKNMRFASNRIDLAEVSRGLKAKKLFLQGVADIHFRTREEFEKLPDSYYLDMQNWIDEEILGIIVSDQRKEHYMKRFLRLK